MIEGQKLAELLAGCVTDLQADTPAGDARVVDALRQIEAAAPGELRALANNLRTYRRDRSAAH